VRASDESPLEVALEQRLAAGPVLLVLDNFEQVLDAARDVARLLKRIPHLKVLVTSRAVLRVRGECEFTLEPFPIPEGGPSDLGDEPAVRLFVERAHAVRPDLELGGAQLAIVTEICARLDGLPLAIELAAARVRLLSLDGLLQRLADRFALLSGGPRDLPDRQRTLRDTIDWSFQMLDEEEQSVFTSLGVFVGGRTLEAAEAVCNSDGTYDVLSAIASLVENSLLRRVETPDGESRFTMLESIHEFAREQLAASGRAAEVHRRHADYFRAFAEKAAARFRGPDGSAWIRRMVDEHGNIRAALSWARANEPRLLLPLIAAVAPFWMVHGDLGEALDWTQAGLASGEGDAHRRAEVMLHQAEIHWGLGRRDQAAEAYEECRKLYEELADEAGLDLALRGEARIALDIGDYERARDVYETSLRLRRKMGWTQGAAETLNNLGLVASLRGDHAGAVRLLEESVSLFSELEDRQGVARGALNLAVSLQALGEFDRAERLGKESLRTWWELEGKWDVADCLEALGEIAVDRHDLRKGMILLEAADRLRDDIAAPRAPYDEEAFVAARERARSGLGDESEDVALTARAMPLERVIDLALSSSDGSARP
jgi:predicted ATPase